MSDLIPYSEQFKKIVNINLSIPDRTPFTSRQAPEFAGYFNEIWEDIQRINLSKQSIKKTSLTPVHNILTT